MAGRNEKDYKKVIAKFPDVRSCLVKSERQKPVPDLRLINWDKFNSLQEMEVCILYIFSSLGSPERTKLWFSFHKPIVSGLIKLKQPVNRDEYNTPYTPGYRAYAQWNTYSSTAPYPSKGIKIIKAGVLDPLFGVSANWDVSGNLKKVKVTRVQSF